MTKKNPEPIFKSSKNHRKSIQYRKLKNNDQSVSIFFTHKGKEYKRSIGWKKRDKITESIALDTLAEWKREVIQGYKLGVKSSDSVTFGEIWGRYCAYATLHYPSSFGKKRLNYEKWLQSEIDNLKVKSIDDDMIVYLQSYLMDEGLKNSTINIIVGMIQTVVNFAVKRQYIEFSHIRNYQKLKVKNSKKRFLHESQLQELLKKCENDKSLHDFIFLSARLGARAKSTLKIKKSDVVEGKIKLYDAKRGQEYFVPMPDDVKDFMCDFDGDGCVIGGGSVLSYEMIYKRFTKIVKYLNDGLEDGEERVTIHTLRHTFASLHALRGTSIQAIQMLLNHSNINTTMIYSHLTKGYLDSVV